MNTQSIFTGLLRAFSFTGALTMAACLDVPQSTSCRDGFACPSDSRCQIVNGERKCVPRCACGNGLVDQGEDCDDGDAMPNEGCNNCKFVECGNAIVDIDEECDCGAGSIEPVYLACRGQQNSPLAGFCDTDCRLHCGDEGIAQ